MNSEIIISTLEECDIFSVTELARNEGFAPGIGDVSIYSHTDKQGLWVAKLNSILIGCIAGVRYNPNYGFIGMFIVSKEYRGKGYGLKLWSKAYHHLADLPIIGLEAAYERINDYSKWGFNLASKTSRWMWVGNDKLNGNPDINIQQLGCEFVDAKSIPSSIVYDFDQIRETCSRPHFLSDWLKHPSGNVIAVLDQSGNCHGFGRIRPCLLKEGQGWRIGPLLADKPAIAELLIRELVYCHSGVVLLDAPDGNQHSKNILIKLGFTMVSDTYRMYRGGHPSSIENDIYCLACLELG